MKTGKIYYLSIFIILFLFCMAIQIIVDNPAGYYDSAVYWNLGKMCGWDVRNITWGFRGWLLPYIFSMCYKFGMMFGKEFLGYWFFSSFLFAFTFTFSFFHIAKMLGFRESDRYYALAGGISGIIFFVFFRGLFIYTLSDFCAFTFSLVSIILVYRIAKFDSRWYIKVIEALGLGVCLYGTYNIRTIYLFSLIACLGILIIWQLCNRKGRELVITLSACFIGIVLCALPQIALNVKLSGDYSWKVPTENLMLSQLYWGVGTERYATYVGDSSQYGAAGMHFADHIGRTILNKEQLAEYTSYGQIVKLFFKYPLDFIGIYVRHLLNMLYPIYPNQYIQDVTCDKSILLVLFYTISFTGISNFTCLLKGKKSKWIWFFLILLPCVCILPGAVEIRFFIALHFLIYMYAVLGIKQFIYQFKKYKLKYIGGYIIGFLLYIAYAGMMLSTTMDGIAIIN